MTVWMFKHQSRFKINSWPFFFFFCISCWLISQSNWNMIFYSELPKHASAYIIISFTSKLYKHLWWVQRKHYISKIVFFPKSQDTCLGKWQDKRSSMWVEWLTDIHRKCLLLCCRESERVWTRVQQTASNVRLVTIRVFLPWKYINRLTWFWYVIFCLPKQPFISAILQ